MYIQRKRERERDYGQIDRIYTVTVGERGDSTSAATDCITFHSIGVQLGVVILVTVV
jgi:hypothetical protein